MVVLKLDCRLSVLLLLNFFLPGQVFVPFLQVFDVQFLLPADFLELQLVARLAFEQFGVDALRCLTQILLQLVLLLLPVFHVDCGNKNNLTQLRIHNFGLFKEDIVCSERSIEINAFLSDSKQKYRAVCRSRE